MGRVPGVTPGEFDRAGAQATRFVEPAQQQTGATQRVVGSAETDASPLCLTLDELLAFPKPVERRARLAELRQRPGGGGDRGGKQGAADVPRLEHRDPVLDQRARLRPVPLEALDRGGVA